MPARQRQKATGEADNSSNPSASTSQANARNSSSQNPQRQQPKQKKKNSPTLLLLLLPGLILGLAAIYFGRSASFPSSTSSSILQNRQAGDFSVQTLLNSSDAHLVADLEKRDAIVEAFQYSWDAYKRDAWGKDNHHPVSKGGSNITPDPIGYFIIDCLDLILLMGLDEEYRQARQWVERELSFEVDDKQHAFEVTIRVLGGLLAAYSMSGHDQLYLEKARDLGDRLLPIFDTPSGIPHSFINLAQRQAIPDKDNNNFASVAEAGTLQLEMRYLSELTGDPKYWQKAKFAMEKVIRAPKKDGLVPLFMDPQSGQALFSDIRLGSRADSYYEYLVKLYVQTKGTEPQWRYAWSDALRGIHHHLLFRGTHENLLYTQELVAAPTMQDGKRVMQWRPSPKQDHLVCFLPGTILLGISQDGSRLQGSRLGASDTGDLTTAAELLHTCVSTYTQSKTGLGAEIVFFYRTGDGRRNGDTRDWYIDKRPMALPGQTATPPYDAKNMLRPETLESLFVAYRLTGKQMYRDQAWAIFEGFNKHCRLSSGGYATIRDVDEVPSVHEDRMETFWIAESLKYLFLIFSDESVVPLDQYVLSTEAHILPQFVPEVTK